MSAVLKPEETKDLSTVLVITDQLPEDFYTSDVYEKRLDAAIEATKNLVYPLDESGEKAAKADATAINKYATLFDKFIAATFKKQTETVGLWRDGKKAKTKLLLENRQRLIDQFAEKRTQKLNTIQAMMYSLLDSYREEIGVKGEFINQVDLSPMIKLTGSLTDGGKLTAKAIGFVKTIANGELYEQNRIEARHLILENRCLKEGINPPLTEIHFGTVFYADDQFFNDKLDELIAAEINRKAEMEARIRKQQEEENERKIQAALRAQQEEANRIARAEAAQKVQDEKPVNIDPIPAAQPRATQQQVDEAIAEKRRREDDMKNPPVNADQRAVLVTATFRFDGIKSGTSNDAVCKFFEKQLPEKLQAILKTTDSKTITIL